MKLFLLKIKTSLGAVLRVLGHPAYAILATLSGAAIVWILLWFFNFNLLFSIFTNQKLDFIEKLTFPLRGFEGLLTNFDILPAAALLVFGILSGLNLAALVFLLRYSGRGSAVSSGSKNLGGMVAALIGSGCAACGGSLLAPLAGAFGATLSITAAQQIGFIANVIAIILVSYSIYGLGRKIANLLAAERLRVQGSASSK